MANNFCLRLDNQVTRQRVICSFLTFSLFTLAYMLQAQAGGLVLTSQGLGNSGGSGGSGSNGNSKRKDLGLSSLAISLGITTHVHTSSSRANVSDHKMLSFRQRYKTSPRAMARDLKRLSGSEYKWVVSYALNIKKGKRRAFRCELRKDKKQLNRMIVQASSLRNDDLDTFFYLLQEYKSKAKKSSCKP